VYLIANPYLVSDASLSSFQNMFNSTTSQLSTSSLSSALSQFAINYLSANYQGSYDAISLSLLTNADDLVVEFDDPIYNNDLHTITVNNVRIS
jgi:hypothetical protein